MKTGRVILLSLALTGCQLPPKSEPVVLPPVPPLQAEPEVISLPEPEPTSVPLSISSDAQTLQAWVNYRGAMLNRINEERDALNGESEQDDVWLLKRTILQLHPDTPYLTRLRVQMQSAEQLSGLPGQLAALLSWDLAFNQKLLEAESAVSALTRLNAQQHDTIDRLQKTNKELQKQIDALTQIEAQLNQPATVQKDNNGQP
jgi:hypothetical protein